MEGWMRILSFCVLITFQTAEVYMFCDCLCTSQIFTTSLFEKETVRALGFPTGLAGGHFPVLLASRSARYHRIQYGYPLFMDKVFRASSIPACEFWPEKFSFRKMTGQFAPKIYDLRIVWSCEERNLF